MLCGSRGACARDFNKGPPPPGPRPWGADPIQGLTPPIVPSQWTPGGVVPPSESAESEEDEEDEELMKQLREIQRLAKLDDTRNKMLAAAKVRWGAGALVGTVESHEEGRTPQIGHTSGGCASLDTVDTTPQTCRR